MKNLLLMRRMYKLRVCPKLLAMQLATTSNNCNLQKQSPKTFAYINRNNRNNRNTCNLNKSTNEHFYTFQVYKLKHFWYVTTQISAVEVEASRIYSIIPYIDKFVTLRRGLF